MKGPWITNSAAKRDARRNGYVNPNRTHFRLTCSRTESPPNRWPG
jgi:hypothetical protein